MTQAQQPEALRLAHALGGGKLIDDSTEWADTLHAADAELRRQHARIEELEDVADMAIKRIAELEAQLSAIGAGGVEPPRKAEGTERHTLYTEQQIRALLAEGIFTGSTGGLVRWL